MSAAAGRPLGALWGTGVGFVTGVPDSVFDTLIAALETTELGGRYVPATREDNAVALAVGAQLAGLQPLVLMESSGLGNALDAVTSLAIPYQVPLILLIAWAGYQGRDAPHHNPIGEALPGILGSLQLPYESLATADLVADLPAAATAAAVRARADRRPAAILVIPPELREGAP
jgi:sulfopyruvate decarboxylase TPP-binding subunit